MIKYDLPKFLLVCYMLVGVSMDILINNKFSSISISDGFVLLILVTLVVVFLRKQKGVLS
ncbi:hypothetical protein LV85_03249 [Algoriphagus chordae]|uniref:Uncharacterized protein n=1 Tax=Algoriphagus chordae TaxID=237019 RepID=A0A2W7QKS1_9BACT|nr:hypothetical protein LV85_03249 [Algoriphagus chordae]